jgi:hypothetical protein
MLRLQGRCVRFTEKPWSMEGRSGITRTARVIVGEADFIDATIQENMPSPYTGQVVDWAIRPGVNNGRLRLTVEGEYESVVPSPSLASTKS